MGAAVAPPPPPPQQAELVHRVKLIRPVRPHREAVDSTRASEKQVQPGHRRPLGLPRRTRRARSRRPHTRGSLVELVCLYAEAEPAKFEWAALRWHARFVTEAAPSLLRAQIALAALRAGSPRDGAGRRPGSPGLLAGRSVPEMSRRGRKQSGCSRRCCCTRMSRSR